MVSLIVYDINNPFTETVSKYLKKLSNDFTPLQLKYSGEWKENTNVELYIVETDVCINEKICKILKTNRPEYQKNQKETKNKIINQEQHQEKTKFFYEDLQCKLMTTKTETDVYVLNCEKLETSDIIWCCSETEIQSIKEIDETVTEYANKEENFYKNNPRVSKN